MNNTTISANILDEIFLEKIHNSAISVSAHVKLYVKLESRFRIDKKGIIYGKPKYYVIEVLQITQPEKHEQTKFNI